LWGNDVESISCLQEMLGYLVSGDTRHQKMFLLVGPKRGGKGTIGRVTTRLLGRHNVAGPTLSSLGSNFGLQDLIGKPVAIISDARLGTKSDHSLITERLLSISGEDLQNVDRKYLPPWSGQLPARFVILTNELPRLADSSGALASRFIVLLLRHSFYDRENPALTDELCAELPGIFLWSLDGLQRLRARGRFQQPQASQDAIQELEDLSSPVGAFIRDRCGLGPERTVEAGELYRTYREWCEEHGRHAVNQQLFGRDLRAVRPEARIRQLGADRRRHYVGIGLGHSLSRGSADPHPAPDGERAAQWTVPRESREQPLGSGLCAYCAKPGTSVDPLLTAACDGSEGHVHRRCLDGWQGMQP
jgi:putative DNA primase/helicase